MDDPFCVCRVQRLSNLSGYDKSFVQSNRRPRNAFAQRLTLDQLHDEVIGSNIIERADVRMIHGRNDAGFAFKALTERVRLRS